jgi:uncharacterized membrane protein YiaA
MGYFLLVVLLIFVIPCYLEKKIRDYFDIQKRTLKNMFVNKIHIMVVFSTLLITIPIISLFFDQFRQIWILIPTVAFIIDMFFELRFRKETKLYVLKIFSYSVLATVYITGLIILH